MEIETRKITRMATSVNSSYFRFGRGQPDIMPAWRVAMTQTNTVYAIGEPNSTLEGQFVWPGTGSVPPSMWGTNEIQAANNVGWNGTAHAEDASLFGKLIFSDAGEDAVCNQMAAFNLDDGTWGVWQQPTYPVSEAEAAAAGADMYWNMTDWNALPASRKMDYPGFWAGWDRTFPIGFAATQNGTGWLMRKKATWTHGNNVPFAYRYNTPAWIPASMTGIGAGAVVVNQYSHHGPFAAGKPSGVSDADWMAETWPSGRAKVYVHYQNSLTKAWARFPIPNPDTTLGEGDILRGAQVVDTANKRLYVQYKASTWIVFYYDLSNGIANATVSSLMTYTDPTSGSVEMTGRGSCVLTNGHPSGRRLWYFLNDTTPNTLLMMDLDTPGNLRVLAIPGLAINATADVYYVGFAYRASDNKLILTTNEANGVWTHVISIPSDPTVAADYVGVSTQLALAPGLTLETDHVQMYGRGKLLERLGVIFMKQYRGPLLAYRPS